MRALLLLPLQRLILSIRLRVTEHLFTNTENTTGKTLRISLFLGCVCAGALVMYGTGLEVMGFAGLDYTNTQLYPSRTMLIFFLGYILLVVGINWGLSSLRAGTQEKRVLRTLRAKEGTILFIKEAIIRGLLLAGGYFILGQTSIAPVIIYYLLVAGSEEGLKRLSSLTLFKHHAFTKSDLMLFALLVSLGFAFLENIIYMLQRTESLSNISSQLSGGSAVLLSRGLVGFLVHMLFTGSIAYLSLYSLKTKNIFWVIGALLVGIGLHMSYNVLLYYNITIVVGLYLVLGYFLLSRLFYQSDSVYLRS